MTRISLTSFCIGALLMGSSSLAWGETAMAQISADETVEFDIPEQDLASALTQVGIQSQREIIFADNIARGPTASGLQRRMTPEHAVGSKEVAPTGELESTSGTTITPTLMRGMSRERSTRLGMMTLRPSSGAR